MEQLQKFSIKYNASITISTQRRYDVVSSSMTGTAMARYDVERQIQTSNIYEIKIGERELAHLIREDERHNREMHLVNRNETVRAAYEQYQLTVKLCQTYYTE